MTARLAAIASLCLGAATAQESAASRPASPADASSARAQVELLPARARAMRVIYRRLDPDAGWFVGADAVLADFESLLFRSQSYVIRHQVEVVTELLPKAMVESARQVELQPGGARWRLVGALATATALLGCERPRRLPEALDQAIAAELADVQWPRCVVPRFVRSMDPSTVKVDWTVARPAGIYTLEPAWEQLFRAAVYLRHLDPSDLATLGEDEERRGTVRKMLARLRNLELIERTLWGPPAVPLWQPGRGEGALLPWVDPPEEPILRRLVESAASTAGPLDLVGAWLRQSPTPKESVGDSFRALYVGGLRALVATKSGVWLGPALCSQSWSRHQLEAAAWGYDILRQVDALETRGPVTGLPPIPAPSVWVEPVPAFYARMERAAILLHTVAAALREELRPHAYGFDVAVGVEETADFCACLLALSSAQADGRPGDAATQAHVRKRVHRDLEAPFWNARPEVALDGAAGRFRMARGDCRAVRVPIVWQGRSFTAVGGIVTTLVGSGDGWRPALDW